MSGTQLLIALVFSLLEAAGSVINALETSQTMNIVCGGECDV